MNIAIIGSGYVGLVTGACLAELGNKVVCVDNDPKKTASLKKGRVPIFEPGLEELILKNVKKRRLSFSAQIRQAVKSAEVIFIAVGTPSLPNGEADMTGIENVARNIAVNMDSYRLIVEKSTVPVETGEWVKHTVNTYVRKKVDFDVASNPEFLREGSAINDFMHPDRIVIGVESERARDIMLKLYRPLRAPIVVTNIQSAELIKHASNAFLATKISFVNAVSQICEKVGADIKEVASGMGLDRRIGKGFLAAGLGYGGSCFPKDLDAFIDIADKSGCSFELLEAAKRTNAAQRQFFLAKIKKALWVLKDKKIAALGLSFKPNTDDIRNSPAIELINSLINEKARIMAYDPQAMPKARQVLRKVKFCKDPYEAASGADCLLILTEWDEFRNLDFLRIKRLLKRRLIIDGRNMYDLAAMEKAGYTYICIGRSKRG